MPALRNLCIYSIALYCSVSTNIHAQLSSKDSSLLKNGIQHILELYDHSIGEQSGKFNGSQNIGYPQAALEKNPYFLSPNFEMGSLVYDQVYYPNTNLLFDEVADVVLFQDSTHKLELVSERIQSFSIAENKFEYLFKKDANSDQLLKSGFYQVLTEGKNKLYKKESKKLSEKIVGAELNYELETSTYYYVLQHNRFIEIPNKKAIFRLFKDKEKELKKIIKSQHLSYRKEKDKTLVSLVDNYNLLIQ